MAAGLAAPDGVLLLCDRRYADDFEGEGIRVAGRRVRVRERPNAGEGTAHSVWDGAVILAAHLEHGFGTALEGCCAVELGAGTGLVGCASAALGAAPVVLTDLPYALEGLRWAAAANEGGPIVAVAADWKDPGGAAAAITEAASGRPADVLLLSDAVWLEQLVEPLVRTLEAVTDDASEVTGPRSLSGELEEGCRGPLLLACHQTRSARTDSAFFAALEGAFEWRRVDAAASTPASLRPSGPIFLIEARRRA